MLGPQLSKNILNNWFTPCGVLWTNHLCPLLVLHVSSYPKPLLFRALILWSLQPYFEYILSLGPGSVDKYHKTDHRITQLTQTYPINPNLSHG